MYCPGNFDTPLPGGRHIKPPRNASGRDRVLHPITLRFSDGLERAYRRSLETSNNTLLRISVLAALAFWTAYAFVEVSLFPNHASTLLTIRFAIFPPVLALGFATTFLHPSDRVRDAILVLLIVSGGASIAAFYVIAPPPHDSSYVPGLVVVFLFGYAFSTARFLPASIAGISVIGTFVAASVVFEGAREAELLSSVFILLIANAVGMFSCYSLEKSSRLNFLHRQALQSDAELAASMNTRLEELAAERTAELERTNNALRVEIDHRRGAEEKLHHLATHDVLSGLANRRFFEEQLQEAIDAAGDSADILAVLFVDVDNFKEINDIYGHRRGDAVLRQVAGRLSAAVRRLDLVGRLGGDEFTVLLTHPESTADVEGVLERLREAMQPPIQEEHIDFSVTVSIGAAMFPDDADDVVGLIRCADSAMYQAKARGRNTFAFFSRELDTVVARRDDVERRILPALHQGEFHLLYQPKIAVADLRCVGIEALLRWESHDGPISPDEFIPIAEESGAIRRIGSWVLARAARYASETGVVTNINVSTRQFGDASLVREVEETLDRCSLSPNALCLEVTESGLMHNLGAARETILALRRIGVQIAIDDFGTGYSSLSYLSRLPIDELKIDKSFVSQIGVAPQDEAIVRTVIGLARSIGARVVAEGVETDDQLGFLRSAGCDIIQGYLVSPPITPADAADFVRRSVD